MDRLSRSLLDFARLIDRFEQDSVSFVSVTQQFNTTTSLGRLTLNILLSFAQFEREIIGERTRNKVSAARAKATGRAGRPCWATTWTHSRQSLVNQRKGSEAPVLDIFRLYESHRSIAAALEELHRSGWTTKSWTTKQGSRREGGAFTKATLLHPLINAVHKVEHKGVLYGGDQASIVEQELWENVNAELVSA